MKQLLTNNFFILLIISISSFVCKVGYRNDNITCSSLIDHRTLFKSGFGIINFFDTNNVVKYNDKYIYKIEQNIDSQFDGNLIWEKKYNLYYVFKENQKKGKIITEDFEMSTFNVDSFLQTINLDAFENALYDITKNEKLFKKTTELKQGLIIEKFERLKDKKFKNEDTLIFTFSTKKIINNFTLCKKLDSTNKKLIRIDFIFNESKQKNFIIPKRNEFVEIISNVKFDTTKYLKIIKKYELFE